MTKIEIRNYILITLGFTVVFLMFLFHLLAPINSLLLDYNRLVDYANKNYDTNHSHRSIVFFGERMESIVVLIDTLIVAVIIIIALIVYLSVRWSVKK